MAVLHDIVARKRVDVAARKRSIDVRRNERAGSFRSALAGRGARFILEAKRRSPSAGELRPALDAGTVVAAYEGIADAVSVVVDEPFFGGSLEFLAEVRALTALPLLCKDFVVDAWQVGEAANLGADAILLMMSVLDDAEARRCLAEAERCGLDALVEVHDEVELDRALALGARIIGINHRSFQDLSVSLDVSARLAPRVPADVLLVAESGIGSAADVALLAPRADAFLVGSSLMKSDDVRRAAAELVYGRVKICGLTNDEDATLAARSGATHLGVVLAKSKRQIDEQTLQSVAARHRVIGVFQDDPLDRVVALSSQLAAVQLHGNEPSAYVAELRRKAKVPITRAIAVDVASDEPVTTDEPAADRLLFDAKVGASSGGTGVAFAWRRIAQHPRLRTAWLAGGLTVENASEARAVGAYGLDVSSGVEASVGRKSPEKLAAFFEALRVPVRAERKS